MMQINKWNFLLWLDLFGVQGVSLERKSAPPEKVQFFVQKMRRDEKNNWFKQIFFFNLASSSSSEK